MDSTARTQPLLKHLKGMGMRAMRSTAMTAVLLEPHQDDAVLFSCFNLIRHRAHVITVLESQVQETRGTGITQEQRAAENEAAIVGVLGLTWEQWHYPDTDPDWISVARMLEWMDEHETPEIVFAPEFQEDGHEHHNRLGALAAHLFGDRVVRYHTYSRHLGKSRGGTEVPFELPWVTMKLRALACYRSQIETEAAGCYPHFLEDLREYVVS